MTVPSPTSTVLVGAADADASRSGGTPSPSPSPSRRRGPVVWLVVGAVRVYQVARGARPSPCRYLPTCSAYAIEALERHGAWRGSWLALRRVLRCHPWGGHGFDPVPDREETS